jgi:hypothetical protein
VVDTRERRTKAVPRRDAKAQTEVLLAVPALLRSCAEPEFRAEFLREPGDDEGGAAADAAVEFARRKGREIGDADPGTYRAGGGLGDAVEVGGLGGLGGAGHFRITPSRVSASRARRETSVPATLTTRPSAPGFTTVVRGRADRGGTCSSLSG